MLEGRHVGNPLDLDCWIGLPEEHEPRVARTITWDLAAGAGISPRAYAALTDRDTLGFKVLSTALRVPPLRNALARRLAIKRIESDPTLPSMSKGFVRGMLDPRSATFQVLSNLSDWMDNGDTREAHAAEIPSSGAIASARGLAGVYAPLSLGGEHKGVRIVSEAAIPRMRAAQSVTEFDAVIGGPTSYTLGFSKSWNNPAPGSGVRIGEDAFGAAGRGGQIGFADPSYRLAFAYVMNRHSIGTGLNERGQSLVDATYECLGSPGKGPGFWMRPA